MSNEEWWSDLLQKLRERIAEFFIFDGAFFDLFLGVLSGLQWMLFRVNRLRGWKRSIGKMDQGQRMSYTPLLKCEV